MLQTNPVAHVENYNMSKLLTQVQVPRSLREQHEFFLVMFRSLEHEIR